MALQDKCIYPVADLFPCWGVVKQTFIHSFFLSFSRRRFPPILFFEIYISQSPHVFTLSVLAVTSPAEAQPYCAKDNTAMYPHAGNCAQYFDCSLLSRGPFQSPYLTECFYPSLYDVNLKKCRHFTLVNCIGRMEPKASCKLVFVIGCMKIEILQHTCTCTCTCTRPCIYYMK